jgi:dihydrofolate reductase
MNITIITAHTKSRVIGLKNKLPWHIQKDLTLFQKTTRNHILIMGRKTFESIGKPLPNRISIILSKKLAPKTTKNLIIVSTISTALHKAKQIQKATNKKIFVIGGSQIYRQFLPYANNLIISHVKKSYNGDKKFPKIKKTAWKLTSQKNYKEFILRKYKKIKKVTPVGRTKLTTVT